MGYGIVPKNIRDIIHSKDDEIQFVMNGIIDEYETYTYNIPVPKDKDTFPFFAKATLVYFPKCNRDQGVDKFHAQTSDRQSRSGSENR